MTTQRREQVIRLAQVLEIEHEPGIATAELMDLCILEADGRMASESGRGSGRKRSGANDDASDDAPELEHDQEHDGEAEGTEAEDAEAEDMEAEEPPASERAVVRGPVRGEKRRKAPEHRPGGSGARKLHRAARIFETEQQRRAEAAEAREPASNVRQLRAGGADGSATGGAEAPETEIAPVLVASRPRAGRARQAS